MVVHNRSALPCRKYISQCNACCWRIAGIAFFLYLSSTFDEYEMPNIWFYFDIFRRRHISWILLQSQPMSQKTMLLQPWLLPQCTTSIILVCQSISFSNVYFLNFRPRQRVSDQHSAISGSPLQRSFCPGKSPRCTRFPTYIAAD